MARINLRNILPGVRGFIVHVFREDPAVLVQTLSGQQFQVIQVAGDKIKNETSFFQVFAQALSFPEYFGENWDAWHDSLSDFGEALKPGRVALVWHAADRSFKADPQSC